jgi:hypothetical protein
MAEEGESTAATSGEGDARSRFVEGVKSAVLHWLKHDPEFRRAILDAIRYDVYELVRREAEDRERQEGPRSPFGTG